ncbi:replicative DNA helicase [candidate division KSB1 bacterium]
MNDSRIPPQSITTEQTVLGSCLLDRAAVYMVTEIIDKPKVFYKTAHQKIYEAILHLDRMSEAVDLVTVTEALEKNGTLREVGGSYYLTECINQATAPKNAGCHAKIVKEKYEERQMITLCHNAMEGFYDNTVDAKDAQEALERGLFDIYSENQRGGFMSFAECNNRAYQELLARYERDDTMIGLPTGIPHFDKMLCGLQAGKLYVIAGRPSHGKSSLAIYMALHMAKQEIPVGFFSLEVDYGDIVHKIWAAEAKIDSQLFQKPRYMDRAKIEKLKEVVEIVEGNPIYIDDSALLTSMDAKAKTRQIVQQNGVQCLFVDYMQLMEDEGSNSEFDKVTKISRTCKAIAKECQIPVVMLSQLSRAVEAPDRKSSGFKPILSDLRQSGQIEQDMDAGIFVYQPYRYKDISKQEYYKDEIGDDIVDRPFVTEDGWYAIELNISKQRNGPTGMEKYWFNPKHNQFKQMATVQAEPLPEKYIPEPEQQPTVAAGNGDYILN